MRNFDINSWVRPLVLSFDPYQSARDLMPVDEQNLIFLDANENAYSKKYGKYPDPQQNKLKQIIANQKSISSKQIILGNGSDELIDILIRAFCEPNQDEILILSPTYGMYGVSARLNAVGIREVLLTSDFRLDVEAILSNQTAKTKILFVCSPNNPSGNLMNEQDLEKILMQFNGLVVIDEAYIDFSSSKGWVSKLSTFQNLIILQTLSKSVGLAGLRIGMMFANEQIISLLNRIKPPYNINAVSQHIAIETLTNQHWKSYVALLNEERSRMQKELLTFDWVKKVFPSEANFLLVEVDDAKGRYEALLQKGIVVRNRHGQPLCHQCLRISVGTKEENDKLLKNCKLL